MATYYISTTGNDTTGDGSLANPWATIGKAYASCASGDTVIMIGHVSNRFAFWNRGDNWYKSITFVRQDDYPKPIIDCSGGGVILCGSSATIVFDGVTFENGTTGSLGFFHAGYYQNDGTIWFKRCVFRNFTVSGGAYRGLFGVHENSSVIKFDACLIYEISSTGGATVASLFLAAYAGRIVFNNSIIYLTATSPAHLGFIIWHQSQIDDRVIFKSSIICSIGATVDISYCSGLPGINAFESSSNNCVFGLTGYLDGNSGQHVNNTTSALPGVVVMADPMFVDPQTENFNTRPGSPVESKGVML